MNRETIPLGSSTSMCTASPLHESWNGRSKLLIPSSRYILESRVPWLNAPIYYYIAFRTVVPQSCPSGQPGETRKWSVYKKTHLPLPANDEYRPTVSFVGNKELKRNIGNRPPRGYSETQPFIRPYLSKEKERLKRPNGLVQRQSARLFPCLNFCYNPL